MTESEWLVSTDPQRMLGWLVAMGDDGELHRNQRDYKVSNRKLRLFACACCRQPEVWDGMVCPECKGWCGGVYGLEETEWECQCCEASGRVGGLTDPRSRRAVEVAERYADGLATEEERRQDYNAASAARRGMEERRQAYNAASAARRGMLDAARQAADEAMICCSEDAIYIASYPSREPILVPLATQTALLREIVGNPFRPVGLPWVQDPPVNGELNPPYCPWLTWNDGLVLRLARTIYDGRQWHDLPKLADALEEAGCTEQEILRHLRGEEPCQCLYGYRPPGGKPQCRDGWIPLRGPHARGCWVLDLILGKE